MVEETCRTGPRLSALAALSWTCKVPRGLGASSGSRLSLMPMAPALPLAEDAEESAACRAGSLRTLEDACRGATAGIAARLERGSKDSSGCLWSAWKRSQGEAPSERGGCRPAPHSRTGRGPVPTWQPPGPGNPLWQPSARALAAGWLGLSSPGAGSPPSPPAGASCSTAAPVTREDVRPCLPRAPNVCAAASRGPRALRAGQWRQTGAIEGRARAPAARRHHSWPHAAQLRGEGGVGWRW